MLEFIFWIIVGMALMYILADIKRRDRVWKFIRGRF